MKWLKKNWGWILVTIIMIWGFFSVLDMAKNNKQYKESIENLDIDILGLERKNEAKEIAIKDLMTARAEENAATDKKIAKMKDNQKRELARIGSERDDWKAKVKDMPPSVVVIEIRTILKTDEIWERPDGILFSLVAAKDCLAILGDFSLVEACDNVQYNARNSSMWCADNPREKREVIPDGTVMARYIGDEPKMEVCEILEKTS